jgi:hypothetical protein
MHARAPRARVKISTRTFGQPMVLSAEFGQKNLHSTENKSRKNINIKIFLQNFKCSSTQAA